MSRCLTILLLLSLEPAVRQSRQPLGSDTQKNLEAAKLESAFKLGSLELLLLFCLPLPAAAWFD